MEINKQLEKELRQKNEEFYRRNGHSYPRYGVELLYLKDSSQRPKYNEILSRKVLKKEWYEKVYEEIVLSLDVDSKYLKEKFLEQKFMQFQNESNPPIENRSMSLGDIIVIGGRAYMVDKVGFEVVSFK